MKKAVLILCNVAVLAVILLTALCLAIQLPSVQTFTANKVIGLLTENLDGKVSMEKIHLKPLTTLIIKNIDVIDKDPFLPSEVTLEKIGAESVEKVDTLLHADYLVARFSPASLFSRSKLRLFKVSISGATINLVLEDGRVNLERMFGVHHDRTAKAKDGFGFNIRKVKVSDTHFTMRSYKEMFSYTDNRYGVKWSDLDVKDITIDGKNLDFKDGVMTGICTRCSFREKSGYECLNVSGRASVGKGVADITDIRILDKWSDIRLPHFMMCYDDGADFKYFTDRILLDADLRDTELDMKSLSYFVPSFENVRIKGLLNIRMTGSVNGINLHELYFKTVPDDFNIRMSGEIDGLPSLSMARLNIKLDQLNTTTSGFEKVLHGISPEAKGIKSVLEKIPEARFSVASSLSGKLNALKAKIDFKSSLGNLDLDSDIRHLIDRDSLLFISGDVHSEDLDIGSFIGNRTIRECSMGSHLRAYLGENGDSKLFIDSLMVSRLNVNDYNYSRIGAVGTVSRNSFSGKIVSQDPSLNFLFQGVCALSSKTSNALYQFYANIGHADLHAMNIDKRPVSNLNMRVNANFNYTSAGDLLGNIDIADLVLESESGTHDIGNISIASHSNGNKSQMTLMSSVAKGSFTGSSSIFKFINDLTGLTAKREIPAIFKKPEFDWEGETYNLDFNCLKTSELTAFFNPGLYIDNNTSLSIDIDAEGRLDTRLKSKRLAIRNNFIKDIDWTVNNVSDSLNGNFECGEIRLGGMNFTGSDLKAFANDNDIGLKFSFTNDENQAMRHGRFEAKGHMSNTEDGKTEVGIDILPSEFILDNERWRILPTHIGILGKDLSINNLKIDNGKDGISIDGGMSGDMNDTLSMSFMNFPVSVVNNFINAKGLNLGGTLSGSLNVLSENGMKGLLSDLVCDSTRIAGTDMGRLTFRNIWDKELNCYVLSAGNGKSLRIGGRINPLNGNLDIKGGLDSLDIGFAQPLLSSVFSEMSGYISGDLLLSGTLSDFQISSRDTRFVDTKLAVAFTGVPYTINGGFRMDEFGVYFEDVNILDRFGHEGKVSGDISYNRFNDIRLATGIRLNRMEVINLKESQANGFYGNIFGSGNVSIKGPLESIGIDVNMNTSGAPAGSLHIPLGSSATAGKKDLLKFSDGPEDAEVDLYEEMMRKFRKVKETSNELAVKVKVMATPDVEGCLEFDKGTGNVLYAKGNGNIELNVIPSREVLDFRGDYRLTGGNYKFVALGIASRDFTIQEGSSITFNGDIMESTLDIDAMYKTKASLSSLIADTTSVISRRVVECGIKISDKLLNPQIGFSINVPDLDPTTKSKVENALSTQDKVQKQFLSLIISNNFLPDEQSGIINNSSVLYSNVSEIMSRQLNNIFERLDIPLDLGLNYQPNQKGRDIFDVAISTQLFNNRVTVNGNIGNRQRNKSSRNDVVGDLDIDIKLDRSGAVRLNIFSHSADQYTNFLDNSQRNGIGITYQQEFYNFKSFFKQIGAGKKKREMMQLQEYLDRDKNVRTIKIYNDDQKE